MRDLLHMSADEMHVVFREWNKGDLDSYLIEITRDILAYKDTDGKPLVDKILDTAGQKGTGKWTAVAALDLGIPLTLIGEAVFARCLSAVKEERVKASKMIHGPKPVFSADRKKLIERSQGCTLCFKNSLICPGICTYESCSCGIQMGPQLWRYCSHVEGRLYNQVCIPRKNKRGI